MTRDFVHLHAHSQYSLYDGFCGINDMAKRAAELGMKHLALTDHGTLAGAIKFFMACQKNKINPVIGCEFYINPNGAKDRSKETGRSNNHLLVLASNMNGFKNIKKLSSVSHYDVNKFYKPRIDFEILDAHRDGLIISSACLKGEIAELLSGGDDASYEEAKMRANKYREAFGDNYYLELMLHTQPCESHNENFADFFRRQKMVFDKTIRLSKETGIPTIVTNDVHYIHADDFEGQQFKKAYSMGKMNKNKEELEKGESHNDVNCYFMKSPEQMYENFIGLGPEEDPNLEGSLQRTLEVAEKCSVDIPLFEKAKIELPSMAYDHDPVYESFVKRYGESLARLTDDAKYLYYLAYRGLAEKGLLSNPAYRERLDYELAVIGKTEYAKYLQIVRDYVKYARDVCDEYVGDRGSAAGSLTLFALDITTTDPVAEGLNFERFLTAEYGYVALESDFL